ncbi:MAG: prolipoprotein diacylglyceryl transferase [Firmicutes bacterium]|nr:prolipoprotein diacylglyceryl transferase [Bacillota bacterium]
MRPILFYLFGLPVYAYGTFVALAFIVAIILAQREAVKEGFQPEVIIDIALALCLGGLVGARLLFVLLELDYYLARPWEILDIRAGGLSFFGAAVTGFAAAWFYGKRKGLPCWRLADLCVPYAALGYAIARIGCLLNGCCYGVATTVPWAMACRAGDPTLRHPTQIYAGLGSLLLFVVLYRMRRHRHFPGFLFFLYMGLYAVMRGIVETFRESQVLFAGVRTTHLASLGFAALAAMEIWRRERRWRREESEREFGEEMDRGTGRSGAAS